jgi:hypothetical protein
MPCQPLLPSAACLRRRCGVSVLDADVEDIPMVIDSPPEIVLLPLEFEKDLVEVPFVAQLRTTPTELVRNLLPGLPTPLMDRLVRHDHTACCEQRLDLPKAELEAEGEPRSRWR